MLTATDTATMCAEIGDLSPKNQRQRRACYALCHILYPVSAAHVSIFRAPIPGEVSVLLWAVQGNLAHNKTPPPSTLPQADSQGGGRFNVGGIGFPRP